MKLTDEQFNAIVAKLTEKTGLFKCPVCGKNENFHLTSQQYQLLSFNAISMICPKCGYILFFDIDTLGQDVTNNKAVK